MWGRAKEKSWISLALKPCFGSTGMFPMYHCPGDFSVYLYEAFSCCMTSDPVPASPASFDASDMVQRARVL